MSLYEQIHKMELTLKLLKMPYEVQVIMDNSRPFAEIKIIAYENKYLDRLKKSIEKICINYKLDSSVTANVSEAHTLSGHLHYCTGSSKAELYLKIFE